MIAPPRPGIKDSTKALLRRAGFAAASIAIGVSLAARAAFEDGAPTWLAAARLVIPLACAALGSSLSVDSAIRKERAFIPRLSAQSHLGGVLIAFAASAFFLADALAGIAPAYSVAPCLALASIYWDRRVFLYSCLAAIAAAAQLGMIAGSLSFGHGFRAAEWALPFANAAMAAFTGIVVRGNMKPSEERRRYLEAENKELWNLSYRDTLTGLYNRRYSQQVATQILNRAQRYREQLHVFMIDIDHFKTVNDQLGHPVGDVVLKKVAASIQGFVRTSDTAARYGGEEFLVFLVQSSPEFAQYVANRIRDGIASLKIEEVPWQITVSIGVAGMTQGDTVDSLVNRADQFLYQSKQNGRNRVSGA
jgi:diguanylate cyclase (GGDEF)-like protein